MFADAHLDGILGQQLLDELRPFYEAQSAVIEIVFVAHVINLFELLYAIEVEVIY